MGAKKRTTIVDTKPRSANVKTRLTTNKTANTPSNATNKQQKSSAKLATKKSLPIKKRISKEKRSNDDSVQDSKPRSSVKPKKSDEELYTSSSQVTAELKLTESNDEIEQVAIPTLKDDKTKAISKMLKSLDIQISGYDKILPPEEKIIEVLKSSISENVKTKSRATTIKSHNNCGLSSKFSGKREHVDKKGLQSSSSSNHPNAYLDQDSKDCVHKKEACNLISECHHLKDDKTSKELFENVEHPMIETKKKMAAKKAKLEASRNKRKQEDERGEEKSNKSEDISYISKKGDSYFVKDNLKNDKITFDDTKSNPTSTDLEHKEDAQEMTKDTEKRKVEKLQLKNKQINNGTDNEKVKETVCSTKDKMQQSKPKQPKLGKEKESNNLPQKIFEECSKKQLKPLKGSQHIITKGSGEKIKEEDNFQRKQNKKCVKSELKEEQSEQNKKKQIKSRKGTLQISEILNSIGDPELAKQVIPCSTMNLPKDVKGELRVITGIDASENHKHKESQRKVPSLTIRQRLQNKYKMPIVKNKSSGKSQKKCENKSVAKKPQTIKTEDEKQAKDIYDFKSGSESEENIKMELPTLKKLREFSDDDDKPLQVAKKKVKEDELVSEKPEESAEKKIEKCKTKTPSKTVSTIDKKASNKYGRKPLSKVKHIPSEASSDEKLSIPTDSEDDQKLSTFGQKRHRMASLNAAAKVQCLYENESRTAYELGLSKTVQIIPKIRNINSGSSSEDEKESKATFKKESQSVKASKKVKKLKTEPQNEAAEEEEKKDEMNVEIKRELRKVPGRGMGKHWEFESDTDNEAIFIEKLRIKKKKLQKLKYLQTKKERKDEKLSKSKNSVKSNKKSVKIKIPSSDDRNSESSDYEDKEKNLYTLEKPPTEQKKKRRSNLNEELIGDYKGILARKRMASLNASAIVAATYEVERHLDRNFGSDCSSFESFFEEENHSLKKSKSQAGSEPLSDRPLAQPQSHPIKLKVDEKEFKESNDVKVDPTEFLDSKDALRDSVQAIKETSRPAPSRLITQDTDVPLTRVYDKSTTGSSQEAYCKLQYHVQSSVTEENVLCPSSVESPKSYTPLGALSSMRPPGTPAGTLDRSTPPILANSSPIVAESINNSDIYQPNDLSHHNTSEHKNYSYPHLMSPSPMSLHLHPTDPGSQIQDYGGNRTEADPLSSQSISTHHFQTPTQPQPSSMTSIIQERCESPGTYGVDYQTQHPNLSMTAGSGSSAFCPPPSLQQHQQQQLQKHHDISGYFQPAGPLISPHVVPVIPAAPQQTSQQQISILPLIGAKGKPFDSDPDRSQLSPLPLCSPTVESTDSDVLITGGDLATFRYPAQQRVMAQTQIVTSQQQTQQQQLHQQSSAAAHQGAPPYPRPMHHMHYTSAYPQNYYSPYPGEAMCYSPPYQSYFPAKVYQSPPPPPSYRRYPPYYQPGPHSGPPTPSDIYEQSPPSGGQPSSAGPSSGPQLIQVGHGASHSQHLEHYTGPPGYYSGYNTGGGGQCYTRSPYMEYPPQCPCPMQQSCPKNVHTGPHIGSNTNNSNNTYNTEATIRNPAVDTTAAMAPAISANSVAGVDSAISKSAVTPNSKSNSTRKMLPVSALLNSNGIVNAKNSSYQKQELNISRGPVINKISNTIHQKLKVSTDASMTMNGNVNINTHLHFEHHSHHHALMHHQVQPCDDIGLLKPLKSEPKSENIEVDSKCSQYEEDVVQPRTPPLSYQEPIEESVSEKDSEKGDSLNNDVVCTIEAFDLTVSPDSEKQFLPSQLVGRKARIGKTMAREMVYAGSAAKHNHARLQIWQRNSGNFKAQQLNPELQTRCVERKTEATGPLALNTNIKSEKIKTETYELFPVVEARNIDEKQYFNKIKTELEISFDAKTSSPVCVTEHGEDDDIAITLDGPKQRIKILEFHKNQCKKSSPNSYKSLIKQTEPKSYLCLSRKIEKHKRFSKFKKSSRNSIVHKRQLVLTDQQKKSLRIRKKVLIALEQRKEKNREKKRIATLAKRAEKRHAARKEELKRSLLLHNNNNYHNNVTTHEAPSGLFDLFSRGYFSEPETCYTSYCQTAGRKAKKSKTAEVRSKSETKKTSSSLLKTERLECSTSTSIKNNKFSLVLSSGSEKSKAHKKHKSSSVNRNKSIVKLLSTTAEEENSITRITEFLDKNPVLNNNENETSTLIDNNNFSEANNNTCLKSSVGSMPALTSSELKLNQNAIPLSSNAATLSGPIQSPSEFVFLRPAIPRFIRHNGTMKRIRSRSKFGFRKRPKRKHSISIEVDETIQPTRPDVMPKWNNGWRWEGEPFQGAVFLNSDDPRVIRTCYPAMRHSEGDIIRPRDCVLLKANEDNELPYVAKVAYLWENPDDGEMMMSLLWYYRPEHTEHGRLRNDCPDEVYASRHRDNNSVACIEDKCYVLVFREYCRYRRRLRAAEEDMQNISIVPKRPNFFNPRVVPENTNPELVMFCRRAYEFRTKRLLKMPNKHDNVTRSSS